MCNRGGGAGNPGSSCLLCSVFVLNRLEWVAIVQDELSACLVVTGEEVLETLGPLVYCVFICVERIGMGCRCARQTIHLHHGNRGGGAGSPGSLSNGLEWVAVMQDELSACLMVTGEEVLETLGPLVSCVGCRYQIIFYKFCSNF